MRARKRTLEEQTVKLAVDTLQELGKPHISVHVRDLYLEGLSYTAGQYFETKNLIVLNKTLMEVCRKKEFWEDTVYHEVAHSLIPSSCCKDYWPNQGHCKHWKKKAKELGALPKQYITFSDWRFHYTTRRLSSRLRHANSLHCRSL